MTFRCHPSRRTLAIGAGIMGGATLLITVIIAGVLISNKNQLLDAADDSDLLESQFPGQYSALHDLSDMYCLPSRKQKGKSADFEESWPLTGPVVPECDGKFSIETFDDEQAFNQGLRRGASRTSDNSGGSFAQSNLVLPTENEIAQTGHYSGEVLSFKCVHFPAKNGVPAHHSAP